MIEALVILTYIVTSSPILKATRRENTVRSGFVSAARFVFKWISGSVVSSKNCYFQLLHLLL